MTSRKTTTLGAAPAACFLALACAAWAQDPVIGPQVLVNPIGAGNACNETSTAAAGSRIVGTWNDYRNQIKVGVGISFDGGETFTDYTVRPPQQFQSGVEGDPMTAYDHETGTLWIGGMSFAGNGGIFVARLDPDSETFNPSVMARINGGIDKGWMEIGPLPQNPNQKRMYITYNQGLIHSSDLGDTWTLPQSLGSGLGFLPRIGPNGELYILYWDTANQSLIRLRRSFDGGQTVSQPITVATRMDIWGIDGSRFAGGFRVAPLPYLAVDRNNGNLYVVYFDTTNIVDGSRNVDLYFTRSTDQGSTWTQPRVINGDSEDFPGDQFFPWLEVDSKGRIHMLFYDTRGTNIRDNSPFSLINAYYSYSDDEGDTWTEHQLTPQAWDSRFDGNNGFFIGDYLGMGIDEHDNVYPTYLSGQNQRPEIFTHVISRGDSDCLVDLNGDGEVNGADFLIFLGYFFNNDDRADFNNDGEINGADFLVFLQLFFEGC